ncbi:MAG: hypothetical protein QF492_01055 [Candidatus Krumholzibacteria bacterium]|jgi:hypothetical protein|nr:hypothetical protein [Candidatus Krumholzibacteria bacterium]MDP6668481.1 hypothetical protein [Candidatus Krumholzibacteria bacterium]MDP6797375.1 hypothetical protein [Candidatus Krumholzibacteria bacterium]MDP7021574.1 hypothetical protein [Candidatus Krumholzibacteria bacterium]
MDHRDTGFRLDCAYSRYGEDRYLQVDVARLLSHDSFRLRPLASISDCTGTPFLNLELSVSWIGKTRWLSLGARKGREIRPLRPLSSAAWNISQDILSSAWFETGWKKGVFRFYASYQWSRMQDTQYWVYASDWVNDYHVEEYSEAGLFSLGLTLGPRGE